MHFPSTAKSALAICCLLGYTLFAAQARAQITLTLTETSDASIVAYTFSGTGTWQSTGNRNGILLFNSNISSNSNFVDDAFVTSDLEVSGTISNLSTSNDYAFSNLRLSNGANGDDWTIALASLSGTAGDNYAISGSGTFSLGANTFSNLIVGSSTSNVGTGTTDLGAATLTVQALSAVPEPSTYAMVLGFACAGFAALRRRRRSLA